MTVPPDYQRVLLKISGEALMGNQGYGIDSATLRRIAGDVREVHATGKEIALVVGGGNIYRGVGRTAQGLDRATGDYMGMLATVMNALALQNALESLSVPTRVQSALPITSVAEPYIRRRAQRHMERGRVVIFAAGTGNPFFTTDTAAALRASEMGCELLLKGTKVDGIYDSDPNQNPDAVRYETLGYTEALTRQLGVMDATALALASDNHIPIVVFSILEPGGFHRVLRGEEKSTLVQD
ncbi:MAG: UMP kinase [Rhodospirillales bacterium]|nr:UMP kinase [Rhodospirillales bacterium]